MSSRRPMGRPGPHGSGSRSRTRKDSAAAAARRRAAEGSRRPLPGSSAKSGKGTKSSKDTNSSISKTPTSGKSAPRKPSPQQQARPHREPRTSAPTRPSQIRRSTTANSDRFNKKLNIRFSSGEKTRQLSVRALAILFFTVLGIVIVANPLTQYLDQQQEKRELVQKLEDTSARVELLEQELARWQDDDFVRSQARERLGYVMPGETLYLVSDPAEGTHDDLLAQRTQEVNDRRRKATPFYGTMWDSIVVAGGAGDVENPSNVPLIDDSMTPAEPDSSKNSVAPSEDSDGADGSDNAEPDADGEGTDGTVEDVE